MLVHNIVNTECLFINFVVQWYIHEQINTSITYVVMGHIFINYYSKSGPNKST